MSVRRLATERPAMQRLTPSSPEARNAFIRLVSHELRTPLNSIIGFSEILSAQPHGPLGAPQYAEYAEIIRDSGEKMLRLVNQVVELIRLSEGMVRFDLQPGRPALSVFDAMDLVRADAAARSIQLEVYEHDGGVWALIDPRALRTVVTNLLQNAVRFAPEGSKVGVRLHARAGFVMLEICDEGPGVPEADIDRVLDPFEQGDYALTRTTEGAGLGLPTARLLCEVMGGALTLTNRDTGGLNATVTLLASAPDPVAAEDPHA